MNPLVTKRCSPVEEAIYQDGFQSGATSRDAEIQRLQFALADSEALELGTAERCDQLRAQINDMRAGMEEIVELSNCMWSCQKATELLASTPEQSLAEYRNKVIEECASVCDKRSMRKNDGNWTDFEWDSICGTNELAADEIRAMKEQP